MIFTWEIHWLLPLTLRLILGGLFFFQAYDKLFRIGWNAVLNTIEAATRKARIPDSFVEFSVKISSWIELVGGLLLIMGFLLPIAYLILALDLVMVVFAFSYLRGIWDMRHVFPRIVLLSALLIIPPEWDLFSLDMWMSTL